MWKGSKKFQSSFPQQESCPNSQNNSSKTRRYEGLYYLSSKTKLTTELCKFTYALLVSWYTVIPRDKIPTLNENLQTSIRKGVINLVFFDIKFHRIKCLLGASRKNH